MNNQVKFFVSIWAFFSYFPAFSQKSTSVFSEKPCGTTLFQQRIFEKNPAQKARAEQAEKEIYEHTLDAASHEKAQKNAVVTLPVVFHIIHDGNVGNTTDGQAELAIERLNDAFSQAGAYADPAGTGVDVGIRFCLAKRESPNIKIY